MLITCLGYWPGLVVMVLYFNMTFGSMYPHHFLFSFFFGCIYMKCVWVGGKKARSGYEKTPKVPPRKVLTAEGREFMFYSVLSFFFCLLSFSFKIFLFIFCPNSG